MRKLIVLLMLVSCGGPQGKPGKDGINGLDGQGCSVLHVDVGDAVLPYGGAIVDCGASSAVISNGAPGADGLNAAPSAYAIEELVDPCGDIPGILDQVLFRLANGVLISIVSDNPKGKNTRLSILEAGNYKTTDGSNCHYSVDVNNNLYNEYY